MEGTERDRILEKVYQINLEKKRKIDIVEEIIVKTLYLSKDIKPQIQEAQ